MSEVGKILVEKAGKLITSTAVETGLNVAAVGATLLGEGRLVQSVERTVPEIKGALAGFRSAEELLGTVKRGSTALSETEALIKTAAMQDAPVFVPALWTSRSTVAKTFYHHMKVPQWSAISKGMDARQFAGAGDASVNSSLLEHGASANALLAENAVHQIGNAEMTEIAAIRLPLVQSAANAVTDSRGLARARFGFADDVGREGWFRQGTNKVMLATDMLATQPIAKVSAIAGHELTHYEHLHLMVRAIADEINVGVVPTIEDARLIRNQFKNELMVPLEKSTFDKIMSQRNGIVLSDLEKERAQILRKAIPAGKQISTLTVFAEYEEKALKELLDGVNGDSRGDVVEALQPYRYALKDPNPTSTWVQVLQNNPALLDIVSAMKADAYGLLPISKRAESSLRPKVVEIANKGIDEVLERQDRFFMAYRNRFDEREADAVGDKLYHQIERMERRANR
ncbi:MAG TPA: hypothetical protein V6C97_21880 [Oculatellaceae cyanobacterium]